MRKVSIMLVVALMVAIMALQFGCKASSYEVKKDAENGGVAAVAIDYSIGSCYGAEVIFDLPEGFMISQQPRVYDGKDTVTVGNPTSTKATAVIGYGEANAYVYMKDTSSKFNSLSISIMLNIDGSVAVGEYNVKATIKYITSVGAGSSRNFSSESKVIDTKITLVG